MPGYDSRARRHCAGCVVTLFLLAGCSSQLTDQAEIVKIGIAVPRSGPAALEGEAAENGARLAIEDLNRSVSDRFRFELVVVDEGNDADKAADVALRLWQSEVKAVIGHLIPKASAIAAETYAKWNLPYISPQKSSAHTGQIFGTTFTVEAPKAPIDSAALVHLAARASGAQNIAVVGDRTASSRVLAQAFMSDAQSAGLASQFFVSESGQFDELMSRIKASSVDGVVFTGTSATSMRLFAEGFVKSGSTAKLLLPKRCDDGLTVELSSKTELVCADIQAFTVGNVTSLPAFNAKYVQRFGIADLAVAGASYDSVNVVAQAVRRAKSTDAKALIRQLRGGTFGGIGNPISFGMDGDFRGEPVIVYTARNGRKEPIASYAMTGRVRTDNGRDLNADEGFPWPPMLPSSMMVMERALVTGRTKPQLSLGQVDQRFSTALTKAGYGEKSYYEVPGGFALVTRLERIYPDGSPATDDRFPSSGAGVSGMGLWQYVRALFSAPLGRYRVIVFVVTDATFQPSMKTLNSAEAAKLLQRGFNRLPRDLGAKSFGAAHDCTILVYEFETSVAMPAGRFIGTTEAIAAPAHLDRSRVRAELQAQ